MTTHRCPHRTPDHPGPPHRKRPVTMYITTNLPDGTRNVIEINAAEDPEETPGNFGWAVVIRGDRDRGHIVGPAWTVHRWEPSQEYARDVARVLERTLSVEDAVVIPTVADPRGAPWTALGFWERGEVHFVGLVPGELPVTGGEDVSLAGEWTAHVWAPDAHRAVLEAYHAMDAATHQALAAPQDPLPGV